MKYTKIIIIDVVAIAVLVILLISFITPGEIEKTYPGGENLPGNIPEVFAPGVISSGLSERDGCFSPDLNEFYYTIWSGSYGTVLFSQHLDEDWSEPEVAPFSGKYSDLEATISHDGKYLFFASNRPVSGNGEPKDYDIWICKRDNNTWSAPYNPGPPLNGPGNEFFPSVATDGTVYFTAKGDDSMGGEDIFFCRRSGETFLPRQNVGAAVNSEKEEFNAFIAPDQSYLIFSSWGRPDDHGRGDLYISAKSDSGQWLPARNMEELNSAQLDYCPSVTPDGRYLLFSSRREEGESYWLKNRHARDIIESQTNPLNGAGDIFWVSFTKP